MQNAKIRKINICNSKVLDFISYSYINKNQSKSKEDDWLFKANSFLIGDFIFVANTDSMTKKQLDVDLINHLYKQ